jgi:hypothetical protein
MRVLTPSITAGFILITTNGSILFAGAALPITCCAVTAIIATAGRSIWAVSGPGISTTSCAFWVAISRVFITATELAAVAVVAFGITAGSISWGASFWSDSATGYVPGHAANFWLADGELVWATCLILTLKRISTFIIAATYYIMVLWEKIECLRKR